MRWTWALALWAGIATAASVKVTKTEIDSFPARMFYFKDSDVIILHNIDKQTLQRSEDDGESWHKITDIPDGKLFDIYDHPFDSKRAYAFTLSKTHYMTEDRGKTWKKFDTPSVPHVRSELISFHAKEPDWMLYNGDDCERPEFQCHPKTYYTKNNFKSLDFMDEYVSSCQYAISTDLFETSHKDRVFCAKGRELYQSDNYFKDRTEAPLADGRGIKGLIGLATVKKFIVAATKAPGTDEMALYVTHDAVNWARANFPKEHSLREGSYTVLESTNYSIQIDVLSGNAGNSMGVLFTSNSNGTYFTRNQEHTNHNHRGIIDFEKMSNIQGIVFVNVIDNWEEFESGQTFDKKVKSVISFTDGRHWQDLTLDSGERLHLHSVTDQRQGGKVFSSPAPGLVMGVGNIGQSLLPFNEGDLFVSDNAGLTWRLGMKGPHLYEFGDQGSILVAVRMDGGLAKHFGYSLDHGKTWDMQPIGEDIRPRLLTIRPDSTSQRFVLVGSTGTGGQQKNYLFSLNFEGMLPDCKDPDDYEEWIARHSTKVETECVMGHRQKYKRRKADAKCLVPEHARAALPEPEPCECTIIDYECDFNFVRDGDECVQEGPIAIPEGVCKKPTDTYKGTSGWRKIPGNDCRGGFSGAKAPDAEIDRPCIEAGTTPNGAITHKITEFSEQPFEENFYLERTASSSGTDETIVMRTKDQKVWRTHDHGKTWEEIPELKGEGIVAIYPHDYFKDAVYFITASNKVWYSLDRAKARLIHSFDVPQPPNVEGIPVLSFHPKEKNWLIWTSQESCGPVQKRDCHSNTYISRNNGRDWRELLTYTRRCEFVWREERATSDEQMIYCEKFEKEMSPEGNPLRLIESKDWFTDSKSFDNPKFKNIIAFATMSEFIVVAARNGDSNDLRLDASVDASRFAHAAFPANFEVDHQQAYTVLDSSTHAVFLHVTVNDLDGREYGTILKSNSNGTYYVKSLDFVNRNTQGYVDYEKMLGIEGVALANIVSNDAEVNQGRPKRIKSKITHNDGSDWALISAPEDIAKEVGCDPKDREKCSLHLHGYTERTDPGATYSSPAAIGIMMAVGNVGESLGPYDNAHTFITRDAGVTWKFVNKGQYMWEYGDRGSIIVIVKKYEDVNEIEYSINEGGTWQKYKFDNKKYRVQSITTVPSDISRQFVLWAKRDGKYVTINLDFTGLASRKCKLDEEDPEGGDYDLWTPEHPVQKSACLFGHIAKYHRKKVDRDCFNGPDLVALHEDITSCECTNHDYECDFNYERVSNYECALSPGLAPLNHVELCRSNPDLIEYYPATGYRRIPLDTCKGGKELDKQGNEPLPCPGHEKQYAEKRRISGAGLFFAIVIPLLAAAGVGYWVWHNFEGKFGRIRLGGDSSSFSSDSPLVRYPVAFISGVIAVVAALPLLASSLWRSTMSTLGIGGGYGRVYNTRSSFARGGGDYSAVDDGELLGEDSDEEV